MSSGRGWAVLSKARRAKRLLRPGQLVARYAPRQSLPAEVKYATAAKPEALQRTGGLAFGLAFYLVIAADAIELTPGTILLSVAAAVATTVGSRGWESITIVPSGPALVLPWTVPISNKRDPVGLGLGDGDDEELYIEPIGAPRLASRAVLTAVLAAVAGLLTGEVLAAGAGVAALVILEAVTLARIIAWERANASDLLWVSGEDGERIACTNPIGLALGI